MSCSILRLCKFCVCASTARFQARNKLQGLAQAFNFRFGLLCPLFGLLRMDNRQVLPFVTFMPCLGQLLLQLCHLRAIYFTRQFRRVFINETPKLVSILSQPFILRMYSGAISPQLFDLALEFSYSSDDLFLCGRHPLPSMDSLEGMTNPPNQIDHSRYANQREIEYQRDNQASEKSEVFIFGLVIHASSTPFI